MVTCACTATSTCEMFLFHYLNAVNSPLYPQSSIAQTLHTCKYALSSTTHIRVILKAIYAQAIHNTPTKITLYMAYIYKPVTQWSNSFS